MSNKQITVKVVWGTTGEVVTTHTFNNEQEKDIFFYGADIGIQNFDETMSESETDTPLAYSEGEARIFREGFDIADGFTRYEITEEKPEDQTMTEEQKKEYLQGGGNHCPYCKSDNLSTGEKNFDDRYATVNVVCDDCAKEWTDIYTMTDVEGLQ